MLFIVRIYRTRYGREPFTKWIRKLRDEIAKANVNNKIRRLSLEEVVDSKVISEGIYELRIHYGPGYQVYYAVFDKIFILLLIAGDKSSQDRDICLAKKYWKDFKERYYGRKIT